MAKMTEIQKKIRSRVVSLNEIQQHIYNGRIKFSVKKSVKEGNTLYTVIRTYNDGTVQKSDSKTELEIVSFLNGFINHYVHNK